MTAVDLNRLREAVALHRDRGYVILEVSPPLLALVECAEAVLASAEDDGTVEAMETIEETWTMTDEVDEADLLAQGYVKLDGVDMEQVRAAVTHDGWSDGLRAGVLVPFARQILAAFDQEDTP